MSLRFTAHHCVELRRASMARIRDSNRSALQKKAGVGRNLLLRLPSATPKPTAETLPIAPMQSDLGDFTVLGWTPPVGEFAEHDWLAAVAMVTLDRDQSQWALGDLWIFGVTKYGVRKAMTESPQWRGPSFNACANAASVCRVFKSSRRRELLSFNHHVEVASLLSEQADLLLDWAQREQKSTRDLRAHLKQLREDEQRVNNLLPAKVADAKTLERVERFIVEKSLGEDRAWKLRRLVKVAPDLARQVMDGKDSVSRAYDVSVERTRERERELKLSRAAKSVVSGNVVPLRSRSVSECAADLSAGIAALRRMCDDRYTAETLRRTFSATEAHQLEADARVVLRFITNLAKTWATPDLRNINSASKEKSK